MSQVWIVSVHPVVGITQHQPCILGVFSTNKQAEQLAALYHESRVSKFTVIEPYRIIERSESIYDIMAEPGSLNGGN